MCIKLKYNKVKPNKTHSMLSFTQKNPQVKENTPQNIPNTKATPPRANSKGIPKRTSQLKLKTQQNILKRKL